MATFTKLNGYIEHVHHKQHDFSSDQFTVALSNTAPGSESTPPTGAASACILANVTQISYTNLSSRNLTLASSGQTSGTFKVVFNDLVLTYSGGSTCGPFRYVYIYNDTVTGDKLVGYYDYGSSITLNPGETFTIDLSAANGLLQSS